MGWFHGLQLVEGACASARLSDVVEPWFLGPGKDSDAGAEFSKGVVDEWPDTRFSDAISDQTWSTAGPGPKLALIAGRTVDNPGFFRQALAAGDGVDFVAEDPPRNVRNGSLTARDVACCRVDTATAAS